MNRRAEELFESIGVTSIPSRAKARDLSVAEQQVVEVAKALSYDARIICMDEPAAALAEHEVELLYGIIRRLTARGVSIIYVSHRLREVFDLCDRITVLKDGRVVTTADALDLDEHELEVARHRAQRRPAGRADARHRRRRQAGCSRRPRSPGTSSTRS